jgi:hypothetical protein
VRFIALAFVIFTCCVSLAAEPEFHPKGSPHILCGNMLNHDGASDLAWAFSALWLNRDIAEANARLRGSYDAFLDGATEMTPEIADAKAKWQMRTWVRVYHLFNDRSPSFPSRLEAETQQRIETLLWNYACAKSTVARAQPQYVWLIQGSENHDMMDLGNVLLCVQVAARHGEYRNWRLPDGHTPAEHVTAWTAYFRLYCEERLKHGLNIEIASPTYGKYFVPEWVNIFDFAEDDGLRAKAEVMLHAIWADWSIEQLDGVRGGAKSRCYQGKYSRSGASDSWRMMGELLLGDGDWANAGRYAHPIMGFGFILSTSRYRLPTLITDLAHDPQGRGEYVYISRRPGRMTAPEAFPSLGGHPCWYFMDAEDSRLVRYTWCTPDHVMGCFLVDPLLGESTRVTAGAVDEAQGQYAAISGQNRWQGIVFATGTDARIFPQCFGRPDKHREGVSVTEIQQVAVQHENVMIVQANRADTRNTAMRVYFAPGMRDRLVEESGWRFIEEGDSYAAVRIVSREDGTAVCDASWDGATFLRAADLFAPVVFVTGRRAHHDSLDAFQQYVLGHTHEVHEGVLRYRFKDHAGQDVELALYVNEQRLPEVNGTPIDLAPKRAYDSPFLASDFGSGAVTVKHKGHSLTLDVNSGAATQDGE